MSASFPSFSARALVAVCAVALLALCVRVAPADADAFGSQFPISPPTHVAEGMQSAFQDVVYNPVTGQYLVVYVAATTPTEDDIYGQLLDAAGNKIGPELRISTTSQEHEEFNPPTVGLDSETGRYLVAWDREETVYVQVLASNGAALSGEIPISAKQSDIETEAIAYSPVTHEYLVVWKAFNEGRVYTQRLNQDGVQVGGDDVIVGGSAELSVDDAVDVAYNATSLEYLVVFNADGGSDGEEVYGQLLNLAGGEVGADDFQISAMGPEGDANFDAAPPSVAWNSVLNEYLVGWHGNDGAPLAKNEREVYGQLLAANGTAIGADDFRISDMGPDGSTEYGAFRPRIAFDPFSNQYFVAWHGGEVGLGEAEFEVWGQYLAANGTEIGNNDFRISEGQDGDAVFSANRPAIAFNPTGTSCNYLVTYFTGEPNDNFEVTGSTVFGRFVTAPPACPRPDTLAPAITGLKVTPKVIASGTKAKKKAKKSAQSSKVKNRAKARYSLSEPASVTFTVERKVPGRKVAGTCRRVKGTKKATGKRCPFWLRTGKALVRRGVAGANVKSFSAKSIRKRGLKPGPYRLVAVATDAAGNRSTKAIARFTVANPR